MALKPGATPVPTLSATANGSVCTAVPHDFPPNAWFTVRWGDSKNSDHQTDGYGTGAWQHTYTAARTYTVSARPQATPNIVVASCDIVIVGVELLPAEEP
jgi:hypothetical protein